MKTRIISSIVGLILLAAVLASGQIVLGAALTLLALIALFEFFTSVRSAGFKPLASLGYISSLCILFIALNNHYHYIDSQRLPELFVAAIFAAFILMFAVMIFSNNKRNVVDMSITLFGIFYVVFLFSFLLYTRSMDHGLYFLGLVFIGAWGTDTFAYFTGRLIGKTKKFIPAIVPTKTLEGCFGGVFFCILLMLGYGLFVNHYVDGIEMFHYGILGFLCGVISQIGDWAASAIKRYVKVKDYGRIMPGHGGVLDRFDSILFIAPLVYFYLTLFVL